jgi:hypothetical protein
VSKVAGKYFTIEHSIIQDTVTIHDKAMKIAKMPLLKKKSLQT